MKRSLVLAREAGVYSSINLLCFPGLIDAEDEVEALVAFLRETGVRLVQLRNLNIDPEVFLPKVPMPYWQTTGHPHADRALRREVPDVEIGNFSRPVQRQSPSGRSRRRAAASTGAIPSSVRHMRGGHPCGVPSSWPR